MNVVIQLARIVRTLPEDADVARDVIGFVGSRADPDGSVRLAPSDVLELVNWLVRLDVKITSGVRGGPAATLD